MVNPIILNLKTLWYQSETHALKLKPYTRSQRQIEFVALLRFLDQLEQLLLGPKDQVRFNQCVEDYLNQTQLIDAKMKAILFSPSMFQSTVDFYDRAKRFNADMDINEIGQAMRNIWIINLIQLMENKEIQLTDSAFGYSMLYPYTDNYLDQELVSGSEKKRVMDRFGAYLALGQLRPESDFEKCLFQLVDFIENNHSRIEHPDVFSSLGLIHQAQMFSQKQQNRKLIPNEVDLLDITFRKGGASVLADAYLVLGSLSESQIEFYLLYGIVLQLCDDLQDVREDFDHGHQTLFSQVYKKYPLDQMIRKLFSLNEQMCSRLPKTTSVELKEIIKSNIELMIIISSQPIKKFLSEPFRSEMASYCPLDERQVKKISKRVKKMKAKLQTKTDIETVKSYFTQFCLDN